MAPHFFTVVGFSPEKGVRIPVAFMRKYGGDIQKTVILKVPSGASWKVELVDEESGIRLEKGWKNFAEYYSIKRAHFLVFRYDGNSEFEVVIFDLTATEIEYPSMAQIEEEDDVSVEILENFPKNVQTSKPKGLRHSSRNKTKKLKLDKLKERGRSEGEQSCGGTDDEMHLQRTINDKDECYSYQRAKAFRSENPFVIVFIQPSYVSSSFNPSFPFTFAKNYLNFQSKKYCNISLGVEGREETWIAKCVIYKEPKRKARLRGDGWKEFVMDNSIKAGDACVFELVEINAFKIIIYPA
ncbi:hypothetical protein M9H77_29874 [Catharanthus roseus]|uniref:Uncharacterized protein n=1 Tax=Catharanthus roseus TaxID=4058 RepID=A0ACB9ZWZ3_CATRO|nr:hypothetical protein M9H77_29874 [Catharanthus roseus]